MLTGATIGAGVRKSKDPSGSTLLLTEYLAFVLDHRKSDDVKLATVAFGGWVSTVVLCGLLQHPLYYMYYCRFDF